VKDVLYAEADAIRRAADMLDERTFADAVDFLDASQRVHVAGIGKSGCIARKIAGHLASYGKQAYFLDPVNAMHGDLGAIDERDGVVLISRSGQCLEMIVLAGQLSHHGPCSRMLGLTTPGSAVARYCDVVLDCSVEREACPLGLAPTCSTAVALAMGDALAVAVAGRMEVTTDGFRAVHPAGVLGL